MVRFLMALMLVLSGTASAQTLCSKHSDCDLGTKECHRHLCFNGVCTANELPISGTPCDDGDPCTVGDQCKKGVCSHTVKLDNPECGAAITTLCEFSGAAGTVQECVVSLDPAGDIPTALSAAFTLKDDRAKLHGFFLKRCLKELGACTVVPVKTTIEGEFLSVTLTDTGHFLFIVPLSLKNWGGVGAFLMAHFSQPWTPVVPLETVGPGLPELLRVQVVLLEDIPAEEPVVIMAGPIRGSIASETEILGSPHGTCNVPGVITFN